MKIRLNTTHRFLLTALVVVVGTMSYFAARFVNDPFGPVLRAELPEVPEEKNPKSPYSDQYVNDKRRLVNQMARNTRWSDEDTQWLVKIIESGWPDIEQPDFYENQSMHEAFKFYGLAMSIISGRIGRSIPIPSEIEEAGIRAIIENLDHPQWYVRQVAVSNTYNSGLLERASILDKVRKIAAGDPDERVRRTAQIKLDALVPGDG